MSTSTLSMLRLPALLLLASTTLPTGLAQSGGEKTVTCVFDLTTVSTDSAKDGALLLFRDEGKLGADCAFMPGAKIVVQYYVDYNPATNRSTSSGYAIFFTDKDSAVDSFTGTFDDAAQTGSGKVTFLNGEGALAGIKGKGTYSLKAVRDNPTATFSHTFTYTVNPKR